VTQLQVNQFSHGLLNPGIGCLLSCLGSFLGLRCLTRARAYTGRTRATWLLIASVALGGTGIWVMHFVAMLGYTIPGQEILYNVPMTVISLVAAISVVAVGLFIVGFGDGGLGPVLAGGMIMGIGVASVHYFGMAAVSLHGIMRYNLGLVGISVVMAIVTCAAALTAGLRVRGVWSSLGVAMIMGLAITGMHYTGMDAMHIYADGSAMPISGEPPNSLLLPLLLGASVVTFVLMLIIAMSPNEDEILADASLSRRLRAGASLAVRDSIRSPEPTQPDVFAHLDAFSRPDVIGQPAVFEQPDVIGQPDVFGASS
jgi:NO-binding membrane sensor protein with MHYT domain